MRIHSLYGLYICRTESTHGPLNSSQTGNKSVFGAIRPATVLFVPVGIYSFKLDHALQLTSADALQRDAVLGSEL